MFDAFPFPRITETTPEKQVVELVNYLIQFKETLEFALMNISTENLSPDLINRLNDLGANIEKNKADREEELAQLSGGSGSGLSIYDVIESNIFKESLKAEVTKRMMTFNVNVETGHLEYAVSE